MIPPTSSREMEPKADEETKTTKENLGAEAKAEEARTKVKLGAEESREGREGQGAS